MRDGYETVTKELLKLVEDSPRLRRLTDAARAQCMWLVGELMKLKAKKLEDVVKMLLKQLPGGSVFPETLFINLQLLHLLTANKCVAHSCIDSRVVTRTAELGCLSVHRWCLARCSTCCDCQPIIKPRSASSQHSSSRLSRNRYHRRRCKCKRNSLKCGSSRRTWQLKSWPML